MWSLLVLPPWESCQASQSAGSSCQCMRARRGIGHLIVPRAEMHMCGREACREPPQLVKGTVVAKKASSTLLPAMQRQAAIASWRPTCNKIL